MKTNIRGVSRFPGTIISTAIVLLMACGSISRASSVAQTSSVTIAWNRSMSPDVVGYIIYYGGASGIYTNEISAGNVTNMTISGLQDGSSYYFAARTVNSSGLESGFSTETLYTVSAVAALLQPAFSSSGKFSITVSGVSGYNYVIQASTNLTQWVPVQTNSAPFSFVDSKTRKFNQRFYRAVYVP